MKAKYLIQVQTSNANMGATGWYTISGAMTMKAAKELEQDVIGAEQYAGRSRGIRIIKQDDFSKEVREWNRKAFEQSKQVTPSVIV
jgi:hypothetical protein